MNEMLRTPDSEINGGVSRGMAWLSKNFQVSTDQITWKAASEIEGLYGPTVV